MFVVAAVVCFIVFSVRGLEARRVGLGPAAAEGLLHLLRKLAGNPTQAKHFTNGSTCLSYLLQANSE